MRINATLDVMLRLLLCHFLFSFHRVQAAVSCSTSQTCQDLLYPGSECSADGFCTNPYTKRGCLANRVPGWKTIRVCNSEDAPDAASWGHCRKPYPALEYTEIRLASQNWESAFFATWIVQIILSELLDVPTSLEPGVADMKISFYDEGNTLDYGISYPWDGLEMARKVKDCRKVNNKGGGNYTQCAHAISEVWHNSWTTKLDNMKENGIIEPLQFIGYFGKSGWYVPRFTAERDPTLLTHYGLRGEENRRKLAETFLTPTTWKEYCDQVSPDNCLAPSNVTARAPVDDETEGVMYFSEGLLALRVDFCLSSQAFYNDIALNTSGDEPFGSGYSYPRLVEVFYAANATKSNVILHWWEPEALYQVFIGTDAEFQKVDLPPPTFRCLQSRKNIVVNRCKGDVVKEQGSPEDATRSPAYDVVKGFNIDYLQLDQIFALWLNRSVDRYGFDPRDATCQWVADNLDYIQSFVPPTYPRAIREDEKFKPLRYSSLAVGIVAVVLVCTSFVATYAKRQKKLIRYAQLDFLFLLLAGLLLVSVAAVVSAVSDSDAKCVSLAWLINVGYTLELVPLIIKVYVINRLMQAAKRFRKVELKRASLFGLVLLLTIVTIIFMITWTVVDPPRIASQYLLTEETNGAGETIVSVSYYCRSSSEAWGFISLGVQGFLLFFASVLAFQMRNIKHELNESQSLAIMIYSGFICWVLRLVSFVWLEKSDFASAVRGIYSLILGIDSIASICIYFLPKIFSKDDRRRSTVFEPNATGRSMASVEARKSIISRPSLVDRGKMLSESSIREHCEPIERPSLSENAGLSRFSDEIHGDDLLRYEGTCPCCGRDIEQDLLLAELESVAIPLDDTTRKRRRLQ